MDDAIPISALQHYHYCPRQCALIHVESTYDENLYTLQGNQVHNRVDERKRRQQDDVTVETSLPLWSHALNIHGVADLVEFYPDQHPVPVEYKRDRTRYHRSNEVQLCAQAFCLEEMFGQTITYGFIFYHGPRRRERIAIDPDLRDETRQVIANTRDMLGNQRVPAPAADERCTHCSLIRSCLPFVQRSSG